MSRKLRSGKFAERALSLIFIAGLILPMLPLRSVSAQDVAVVTVGSESGNVGTTVNIEVRITNRSGAAGVQFDLHYNSDLVEPQQGGITWGGIIQELRIANIPSPGRLGVIIAQANPFSGDGILLNIPFKLKKSGTSPISLRGLTVRGTEGQLVASSAVSGNITAQVPKTALRQVGRPVWEGDIIRWSAVEGAASYEVILLKNGQRVEKEATGETRFDFSADMAQEGPGRYTVTVRALAGTSEVYLDGTVSSASATNIKSITLATAASPSWTGERLNWVAVAGAINYELVLYRNDAVVNRRNVPAGQISFNFTSLFTQLGAGSYTATVRPMGDGTVFLHGAASSGSPVYLRQASPTAQDPPNRNNNDDSGGEEDLGEQEKEAILKAGRPVWLAAPNSDRAGFTVAWAGQGENAKEYVIILYRGEAMVTTKAIAPEGPADVQQADLSAYISQPGLYMVRVETLFSGGETDIAEFSDILVVINEDAAAPGTYLAEGYLPFSDIWLQFTADEAKSGFVKLRRFAGSEISPPENMLCAGIYLEVEVDESLAGVSTMIEARYDPALLAEDLNQNTLRFYRYDTVTESWLPLVSDVNAAEQNVWVQSDQFSVLGAFGEAVIDQPEPGAGLRWAALYRIPAYLWLLILTSLAVLLALFFSRRKRRRYRRRHY